MKVIRRSLLSEAGAAEGVVVVIDVLRAFSSSALMFHYGIEELVLVRTPEEALALRRDDPAWVVAGEVKGLKVSQFDIGNSPAEIIRLGQDFFRGRRVVLRSSAGTQGVLAAVDTAEEIVLGSFMTATATARYLRDRCRAEVPVTLLAMGLQGESRSVEDEGCADYLQHLLTGTPYDHLATVWHCLNDPFIAKSLRGERPHMPREDVIVVLQRDVFDFSLVGRREGARVVVRRSGPAD
ncbi:MAG TPA: 2-phosphosulfolactate phosphatase [Thermoanaerobaculia bacterium]